MATIRVVKKFAVNVVPLNASTAEYNPKEKPRAFTLGYFYVKACSRQMGKTMINLSLRHVWIILTVSALLGAAYMFRYDTKPKVNGFGTFVLDRWTGTVTSCNAPSC